MTGGQAARDALDRIAREDAAVTVRRYDTEAMDDLVAGLRAGGGSRAYAADAIDHYRRAYRDLLVDYEKVEENARGVDLWKAIRP